jgi:hypothetical protein
VKAWNDRGYAAIAIDHYGRTPTGEELGVDGITDPQGGPPGPGDLPDFTQPVKTHWQYHAICDVMLANSLLRSLPDVDAERIGLTGLSWGGYLTCLVAGIDQRFKFAAPVYGCGYVTECLWEDDFKSRPPAYAVTWMKTWDPAIFLRQATMPMFWINGTNDFAYYLGPWQKSYRLPRSPRTLSLTIELTHSNVAGRVVETIAPFADSILRDGQPLPVITGQTREGNNVSITYTSSTPVTKAELLFTKDSGKWPTRTWESIPAQVADGTVTAALPEGTTVFFINVFDHRGIAISSEHQEIR